MRCLVTGSEGFIGRRVVSKLLEAGHEVVGVDSMDTQVHDKVYKKLPHPYELRVQEVGYTWVDTSYDVIIHLAAQVGVGQSMYEPSRYVGGNTMQTSMLLEKLARHKPKRLVVASSMSVYGEGAYVQYDGDDEELGICFPVPPSSLSRIDLTQPEYFPAGTTEEHPPNLQSIYALTKYDQEQLSLIWGRANGVTTVALRFFNVYGEGQALTNPYTGVMAIFATRLLNGKPPMIYEDGKQSRDFVNVEDVAEAVVHAALGTTMEPGVYNVGTGIPRTIEEVALALAKGLGVDIKPTITGQSRAGDIRHCYADITKIRGTGWAPRVAWEVGVRRYCKWLKEQPTPVDKWEEAAGELAKAGLVAG